MGNYDLKLLKKLGLKKNNSLYEFGVGYLRSANQFVQYLNINKFGGNDTSSERIERGKKIFPIMKEKKHNYLLLLTTRLIGLKEKNMIIFF